MKNTWFIKGIIAVVLSLFSVVAQAEQVVIAGIYYNFDRYSKLAQVTFSPSYKYSGVLIIPEHITIDGEQYTVNSIGEYAFQDCVDLTSVKLPTSLTEFYKSAFKNSGITSIEIPEGVNYTAGNVFEGCKSLKSVCIPSSLETIGDWLFRNCNELSSVVIREGVKTIGERTFLNCKKLSSIVIPNTIQVIKSFAFSNSGLKEIVIPNSVTRISEGCFSGCKELKSISFLGNVESLGKSSFYGCSALSSISFENNATITREIAGYAFYQCGFIDLNIPEGVTTIGEYAFSQCQQLKSIYIPCTVKKLGNRIFSGCEFIELDIPEGVTTIGDYAFSNCQQLKSISLPTTVENFGNSVFSGCINLEYASISSKAYSSGAFGSCDKLSTLRVNSQNVDKSIVGWFTTASTYNSTIPYREELRTLIIGSDVQTIDANVFKEIKLEDVHLEGETLPEVKGWFSNTTLRLDETNAKCLLGYVPFSKVMVDYHGKEYTPIVNMTDADGIDVEEYPKKNLSCIDGKVFLCDNNTKEIGARALNGYLIFRNLNFSAGVFLVPQKSNLHCQNLIYYYPKSQVYTADLTTAGTLLDIIGIDNVKNVKWLKLSGQINGTDLLVIKRMENLEFLNLEDANIVEGGMAYYESNTTKKDCVGTHFLDGHPSLQTIVLPKSAKVIEAQAFAGCSCALISHTSSKIESIGANAFDGCSSMTSAVIPGNVTSIASNAYNNNNVKALYLSDSYADLQGDQNIPGSSIEYLYLGRNLKSSICRNNKNLQEVEFASHVSEIANDMFNGCTALSTLVWPTELQKVGSNAFAGCTSLPYIKLGSKVQSVGAGAFAGCSGINVVCSLNPTPPDIQSTTFDEATEKSATLYVPVGSKTAYWIHQYWGNFFNIVETDDFESALGIESPVQTSASGMLKVYSLSGQLVKTIDANQQRQLNRNLPAGLYIVGGKKVIVR